MAESSDVAGEDEFLDAGVGDIDINKEGLSDEPVSGDSAADDSIAEGDDEPIGDDIATPDHNIGLLGPITDEETLLLTDLKDRYPDLGGKEATRLRFLRANRQRDMKKQVDDTAKAVVDHLEWDERVKPRQIRRKDISTAVNSGTWRFMGKSEDGHPVIWVQVSKWNPHEYNNEMYEKYVAYFCSRSEHQMVDVATHIVVFDMSGWAMWHARYLSYIKTAIYIVQNQYPERLKAVMLLNCPFSFRGVWPLIKPFMHPNTASKVSFVNGKEAVAAAFKNEKVSADTLVDTYGGNVKADSIPVPNIQW